jgi:hypothetical protein
MKQGTMKTLGVAALGAAFAATGAGTASANGVVDGVESATGHVLSAPPVQQALDGSGTIGRLPTNPHDLVSPDMPQEMAATAAEAQRSGLLGGLPVASDLLRGGLPTEQLTGAGLPTDRLLEGGLPTEQLTGGNLSADQLLSAGLPTDRLTGGALPVQGLTKGLPVNGSLAGGSIAGLPVG